MTTLPFISCVCLCYGRVALINEALESFLRQKYEGRKELILFNTLENQRLSFIHPEVVVINHSPRPFTLGQTRNEAIKHAKGELIVTWDSDDVYREFHLANFTRGNFDPEKHGWVRHDRQLYAEGWQIKGITAGTPNTFAFTKKAWAAVEGYNAENTGEDASLLGRITSKFEGVTINLQPHEASEIYHWDNETFHVSGHGKDKPGHRTAMERAHEYIKERQGAMFEPVGDVVLQPKWKKDWETMAQKFTIGVKKLESQKRGTVGFVTLGHCGDIFNILPCVKHIFDITGKKPTFFTSRMYGQVLDSISYTTAFVMDLPDKDIVKAIEIAKERVETLLVGQVHGDGYQVDRIDESYNCESWRMCGMREHFHDLSGFPLILDRRDKERERRLADSLPFGDKPVMLVNVTGGWSSQWNEGGKMLGWLLNSYQKAFTVLDLSAVRAERIFDVLGLLDRSAVLITSDTYTVHLATASTVPVVCILNDNTQPFGRPWLKSKPRYVPLLSLNYSDAMNRIEEVKEAIKKI